MIPECRVERHAPQHLFIRHKETVAPMAIAIARSEHYRPSPSVNVVAGGEHESNWIIRLRAPQKLAPHRRGESVLATRVVTVIADNEERKLLGGLGPCAKNAGPNAPIIDIDHVIVIGVGRQAANFHPVIPRWIIAAVYADKATPVRSGAAADGVPRARSGAPRNRDGIMIEIADVGMKVLRRQDGGEQNDASESNNHVRCRRPPSAGHASAGTP